MAKSELLPFIGPFFVFAVFLTVQGFFPDQHYALYPVVTVVVAAMIAFYWRELPSLRPGAPIISAGVGVVGVVLWIGLDPFLVHYDQPLIGRNPFLIYPPAVGWILFAFRVAGIAVCVPIMEELFWRGFLMRWLIKEDFTAVALGTYRPFSFWVTTVFFASVHGAEWPLAVVVGVLYGAWFVRTKRLGDIMLAHGVTNLLLALYCLATNDWHFLSIVESANAHK